jgi:hypothetical protein
MMKEKASAAEHDDEEEDNHNEDDEDEDEDDDDDGNDDDQESSVGASGWVRVRGSEWSECEFSECTQPAQHSREGQRGCHCEQPHGQCRQLMMRIISPG